MVRGHLIPIDPADPDFAVHSAWLARVTDGDRAAVHNNDAGAAEKENDLGSAAVAVNSRGGGDRFGIEARRGLWHFPLGTGSLGIRLALAGLAFALAGVIANVLLQQLSSDDSRQLVDRTAETTSLNPLGRNEPARPKLIVEPSRAVAGEPAPLGITLRGSAEEDGIVLIRGLVPGMELSAGRSITDAAWQLPAKDVSFAWIAPPPGFVGSADLVAELQLHDSKVVDRQSIHVEWTTPAARSDPEGEREQTRREPEREPVPPITPAPPQNAREQSIIDATPPTLRPPSQEQGRKKERGGKTAGAHGKQNSRGAARDDSQAQPFQRLTVGDRTNSPKGFWDWSR